MSNIVGVIGKQKGEIGGFSLFYIYPNSSLMALQNLVYNGEQHRVCVNRSSCRRVSCALLVLTFDSLSESN